MRCRRRVSTTIALVVSSFLLSSNDAKGGSERRAVGLAYSAVAGCPTVDQFKAIVIERLSEDAFATDGSLRVLVRITSRGPAFEGHMEWWDPLGQWVGEREFPDLRSDCEDLVRAMAFTLALQLQLSTVSSTRSNASNTKTDTEQVPRTAKAPVEPPIPSTPKMDLRRPPLGDPAPANRPVFIFGVGTLLGLNMSATAIPHARVFTGVAQSNWVMSFAAEIGFPTRVNRLDGAGFSNQQVLASLAGCRNLKEWHACALVKAGGIRIVGKDIDVKKSATAPVIQTGLRAGVSHRIFARSYLSAYAELLVLPIRWSVTLDQNVVWTSPRFAETLGVEWGMHFK